MIGILDQGYSLIPNVILSSTKISSSAKLLYAFISSHCAEKGYCWANNEYLGKLMGGMTSENISRLLTQLKPFVKFTKRQSGKRHIYLRSEYMIDIDKNVKVLQQKCQTHIDKNVKVPKRQNALPDSKKPCFSPPNNINEYYKGISGFSKKELEEKRKKERERNQAQNDKLEEYKKNSVPPEVAIKRMKKIKIECF